MIHSQGRRVDVDRVTTSPQASIGTVTVVLDGGGTLTGTLSSDTIHGTTTRQRLLLIGFYAAIAAFTAVLFLLAFSLTSDMTARIAAAAGGLAVSRSLIDALQLTNDWQRLSPGAKSAALLVSLGMNTTGGIILLATGAIGA